MSSEELVEETFDFGEGEYTGQTLEGMMHGKGTAKFNTGDTYQGEWQNDKFHGKGVYSWADGDTYEGEYIQDKQHGQGILRDKAGVFTGRWVADVREGYGQQVYRNGDIYDGEWKDDHRHGKGRQTFANGSVYEGEWFRNLHHGAGMTRNSVGDVYEGEFYQNKPNGKGKYMWADGRSYVGHWKDGLKHGEGCERLPNGDWVAGMWVNGEHDKKQPIHKVDPTKLHQSQELYKEQLSRLNVSLIQPLPIDQLRRQSAVSTIPATQTAATTSSPNTVALSASKPVTPQKPAAAPAEGRFSDADFQDWQLMKMLGKGSFGAVYEAGLKSGKIVCVKVVELGTIQDPSDLAKLRNEINLMQRLKHPNIVQYYGCTEDKARNTLNIFMEYVTGGTLNQFIKKFKSFPRETVRQWTYQIISGVKYLHDNNIVHRDIKGDNILVTMEGVLKLADFGCSKAIDDVCSKTHGCQTMVGTPYWMAPEVIKCEQEGYGTKSDIWSVGCTIVEMITGKPPWPECNSMWAAVYKIANSSGLPSEIPKDLDPDLMDFLEKCFERNPSKRAAAAALMSHPYLAAFQS